jgi:pimeloyl-ACP methyl ester carboxylesterase
MSSGHVVFSHGKDSGPWGAKIAALAEVARAEGYEVESVDYRGLDDPRQRIARLLEYCRPLQGRLVLVGSSLGAHVCTEASRLLRAEGLFLLAPAFYMPGYEELTPQPPAGVPIVMVHGWRDDVVPVEHSVRWAREHGATLHVYESDHRLHDRIREINHLFEYFLIRLDRSAFG